MIKENLIGKRIKELRKAKGLTQEKLGEILGVQKSAIFKYEKGYVQNLKRTTIETLANFFHVPVDYILGLDEEDERIANLNTEELSQLDKILNETTLFFNAEDVTDDDKILLRKALIEVFFDVLNKNKKK